MKYFINSRKKKIKSKRAKQIALPDALMLIDQFPYLQEFKNGFIGFVNDKNETIQFIRDEYNSWILDFPFLVDAKYQYSYQDNELTTKSVKLIVEAFFEGKDWKKNCDLKRI